MQNKFIVIEGCDGAGKTTRINYLKNKYPEFIFTKEPGGTERANVCRQMIIDENNKDADPRFFFSLFFAARVDHVNNLIIPSINENKTVIRKLKTFFGKRENFL